MSEDGSISSTIPPCCSAVSREGRVVNVVPDIKVEPKPESDELGSRTRSFISFMSRHSATATTTALAISLA